MTVEKNLNKLERDKNKAVSLVLGGGAARGLVHIGVWKYLQEIDFEPGEIIGNSMGAIIGAGIALGFDWKKLRQIAKDQNIKKMIDLDLKWGFLKGERVSKILQDIFGDKTFEDVRFPLKVVAFDLDYGKKLLIEKGKIWEAVRCSMNIPLLFAPFKFNGNWVVDGGVVSNLPVEESSFEQVIAISTLPVDFPPKISERHIYKGKKIVKKSRKLLKETFYRTYLGIMKNNQKFSLLQADGKKILFVDANPSWKYKLYDFSKFEDMIQEGYENIKKSFE